jgi:hypothetical protein
MSGARLMVESKPESPDGMSEYAKWYEGTHVPEVLAIDGFASARVYRSLAGDTLLSVFELDTDVDTAKANLRAAQKSGRMTRPQGMQLDPPPSVRYFRSDD